MPSGINYDYFVHLVTSWPHAAGVRILDYGCGGGEVVRALRDRGLDCYGCDLYPDGVSKMPQAETARSLIAAGHVFPIQERGELPFPPASFGVILSNMVFEHVRDFDETFDRMAALLAPDGVICMHFPTKGVWWEGHMGVPFAHWFPGGSRARVRWLWVFRSLGFGYNVDGKSPLEWAESQSAYLDSQCFYRSTRAVRHVFGQHFQIDSNEWEYIKFRLGKRMLMAGALRIPGIKFVAPPVFRRLAFSAFLLRRRSAAE